jgi:hypothetical protein
VVPAVTPVIMPVDGCIVATPVVPDVHVPPVIPLLSVVVLPAHTVVFPATAVGRG